MIRNNYYRLINYIKQKQFIAAYHLLKQIIKLLLWSVCDCPNNSNGHRIDVIYWPRTAYHWEGKGRDPNGPYTICKEGAEEADQYWDEMWAEYYSSIY